MSNALHHFVPQFYLKRFVGPDGLLWVYDKDTDHVFQANPKNLAAQHGFYTLPEVFPDSSLMEQQFSDLEQEASLITEDWLGRLQPGCSIEIPDVNREIMSLYITLQLLRTCEARTLLVEGLTKPETMPVEEELRRAIHLDLLWNDEIVEETSDWVRSCTWTFRVNELTESLYTSDDPFKARTKTQHLHWAQTSKVGAYLLIPLTPRILMYCFDPQGWSQLKQFDCQVLSIPLEPHLVRDANIHQLGHAQRFVFSDQDDFLLAREFCAEFPGAVGQNRRRFNDESIL